MPKKGTTQTVEERLTALEERVTAVEASATEAVASTAKGGKGKAATKGDAPKKFTTYPQFWKHLYQTNQEEAENFFGKKHVAALKKDSTINSKKGKALLQAQMKFYCDLFKTNPDIVKAVKAAFDKFKASAKESETADDKEASESGSESGSGSGSDSDSDSESGSEEAAPKKGAKGAAKGGAKAKKTDDDSDSGSDSSSGKADGSGSGSDSDSDSESEGAAPAKGKAKAKK
jgi:hypothetical protein